MTKTDAAARPIRPQSSLGLIVIGAGLLVLGVAALLALPRAGAQSEPAEPSAVPAAVDYPAPELELYDLLGNPDTLADYHGQVVLVNVWATWCPPCRAEMPTLEAYYQANAAKGFTVVAVDVGDPAAEVSHFVQALGLTFPVWLDPQLAALEAFKYPGLPSSYVIDRSGVVRLAWTGAISREMLDRHVTPLLES